MTETLYEEYAALKEKEKEIAAKLDELKPRIVSELGEAGVDKLETKFGNFTVTAKRKWTFSAVVKDAEDAVEVIKEREKADGTATSEETPVLYFKAPKV